MRVLGAPAGGCFAALVLYSVLGCQVFTTAAASMLSEAHTEATTAKGDSGGGGWRRRVTVTMPWLPRPSPTAGRSAVTGTASNTSEAARGAAPAYQRRLRQLRHQTCSGGSGSSSVDVVPVAAATAATPGLQLEGKVALVPSEPGVDWLYCGSVLIQIELRREAQLFMLACRLWRALR